MGFSATSPFSSTTFGLHEAFDLPDALLILPPRGFESSGPQGGPFVPMCQSFTLTNTASTALVWRVSADPALLTLSPTGGVLAPLQSTQVTACLISGVTQFPLGAYGTSIIFSNISSGYAQSRQADLRVMAIASMPFHEDFESGVLGPWWNASGVGPFRTRVTPDFQPHAGNYQLTMDTLDFNEQYARNELTLGLDLGGYTNVVLDFWAKSFGDEPNGPPPIPFFDGADFDGVAISVDGSAWYDVQDFFFEVDNPLWIGLQLLLPHSLQSLR
jgi:hypothetical protein